MDLDLSYGQDGESYSEMSMDKASRALRKGYVRSLGEEAPGDVFPAFEVRSLTGPRTYTVRPVIDPQGTVLGCTCTCPNGKSAPRARCYHAAAVEITVELIPRVIW